MKYWYFTTTYYCPQCGRSRVFRVRMYDPRPDEWENRHEEVEAWDYCE